MFAAYLDTTALLFIPFWVFVFCFAARTMRVELHTLSTTWVVNRNSTCDSHRNELHGSIPVEPRCSDRML